MTKKLNFPTLLFLFLHILSPVIAPAKTANKYGFTVYPSEWWHFDFQGWENYDLMDISFEELMNNKN